MRNIRDSLSLSSRIYLLSKVCPFYSSYINIFHYMNTFKLEYLSGVLIECLRVQFEVMMSLETLFSRYVDTVKNVCEISS